MTTPAGVQYPDVTVQLTGKDGNAFAIIGRIQSALAAYVSKDAADAWALAAMMCGSYDELLNLARSTVHVV